MNVRTKVRAEGLSWNRCDKPTTIRNPDSGSVKIRSGVRSS